MSLYQAMPFEVNPVFLADFYKFGHVNQYPRDTVGVFTNWTPRSSRLSFKRVVPFGIQYFIKEILINQWERNFFQRQLRPIIDEYREFTAATLGDANPRTDHIEFLHRRGYLPIEIYSIPEGYSVPINCPMAVITNTLTEAYWLPNYIETILSDIIWKPCTSATIAQQYRKIFLKYAKEAGETDMSFVDWQGHDFSFRGMSGREDAILSGMGHLLSFSGTDTAPAILAAKHYYGAPLNCGGSIPATEHSVMCAGLKEEELATFERLLREVYPTGPVSIVSDTWDLWNVLTNYIPLMKEEILARDGKLVIRPDSGDPVKIVCGDPERPVEHPAHEGAIRLLAKALGTDASGKHITKGGVIYGDSITIDRADQILHRIVHELKMSPYNMVFGIGSFTYEYVTRDTFGFAMKATAVRRKDKLYEIYKKPVTDDGGKISHKGIVAVYKTEDSPVEAPDFYPVQGATVDQLKNCALQRVYANGDLLVDESFASIRNRVRQGAM